MFHYMVRKKKNFPANEQEVGGSSEGIWWECSGKHRRSGVCSIAAALLCVVRLEVLCCRHPRITGTKESTCLRQILLHCCATVSSERNLLFHHYPDLPTGWMKEQEHSCSCVRAPVAHVSIYIYACVRPHRCCLVAKQDGECPGLLACRRRWRR